VHLKNYSLVISETVENITFWRLQ